MASKRRLRRLSCTDKRRFDNMNEAIEFNRDPSMHAYQCEFCKRWHLGHPMKPDGVKDRTVGIIK